MTNPGVTDLLAYWSMEEESGTRVDSHGSYNALVTVNPGYGTGKQGNAADFVAASSQGLYLNDSPGISMGGDVSFCIGFWIKPHDVGSNSPIFSKWILLTDGEYRISISSSKIEFEVRNADNSAGYEVTADTFGTLSNGVWYFVFAYFDASANLLGIGVNNVFDTDSGPSNGVRDHTNSLYFARDGAGLFYYDGLIDEVFIYKDRLLDAAERTWLYNSGSGRTYVDLSTHHLDSVGITVDPVLGTPTATHIHVLDSIGITANPVLDTPSIAQTHVLDSIGITANPVLDTPSYWVDPALLPDLPDPVQLPGESLLIYVLDTSLDTIAIIEDYYSLNWAERYSEVGDFELDLPIKYALDSSIAFGNFLYIKSSDKLMIIEDIKPSFGMDKTSLLINGQSAESILTRRILLDPINVDGIAESIIYTLVAQNVTSPLNLKRYIWPFKIVFPAVSTSEVFAEQLEMQTVYDAIKFICESTGLGFKVEKVGTENLRLQFSVYKGEDRSYDQGINPYVIFSETFDNVIASSFYESEKDKVTMTLVTTEDRVVALRRVFVWEEGDPEPSGLDRSEIVLEAGIERNIGKPPEPPDPEAQIHRLDSVNITTNPILDIPSIALDLPDPEEPQEPPEVVDGPILSVVGKDTLAAVGITITPSIEIYVPYDLTAIGIITNPRTTIPTLYENIDRLIAIGITVNPVIAPYTPPPLTDAEVLAIMTTRGRQTIKENKSVGLFEGDFDIKENFEYGVDFFMGDIVQCNLEGKNVKARIVELVRSYSTEGEKAYIAMDFII